MPESRLPSWTLLACLLLCGWFVSLPLRDILSYPDRLSVLPNLETDAAAYDAFARELAATGQVSALPAKHPPGWMVVLGGVYALTGHSFVAGKLVSWAALIVCVAASALLAHRVFGASAAVIAALLCASSPGLRAYVGTLQYEVLTAALFTSFLALTVHAAQVANGRRACVTALLAGLTAAALVLTRETFVLTVPLAAAWLWQQRSRPPTTPSHPAVPRPVVIAALLIVVAALPAIVWSAVQSAQHSRVILISDKAREVFDAGNNPRANGTYNEPLVGIGTPAGMEFIRTHPDEAIRLAGRKFLYSFGILRDGWNVPHAATVWIWRATTGALPHHVIDPIVRGGWLLAACVTALYMLGRTGWRRWWLLPLTVAAILAVHVVTLASYRFAVPLLPVLYVLASAPLAWVVHRARAALRAAPVSIAVVIAAAIVCAAQFEQWPLMMRYDAADLDGISAANVQDEMAGELVRFADASQGVRPVALLPDTYLPRGSVEVSLRVRRTGVDAQGSVAVARLVLQPLHAAAPCVSDVLAVQVPTDRFVDVSQQCAITRDGPATVAVFSLGQSDLALRSLTLAWH